MSSQINLLENKKPQSLFMKADRLRILRFMSVGILFLVSASSVIIFILIAVSPLPQLKRQERQFIVNLSQYDNDMIKFFLINERTTSIANILSKRMSYDTILDAIQSKLPEGVTIRALSMEKNTVSLTVSSRSLELLNTFVTNITSAIDEKKIFSQAIMTGLSIEEADDRYLVGLTLLTMPQI